MVFNKPIIQTDQDSDSLGDSFSDWSSQSGSEEDSLFEKFEVPDYSDYLPNWSQGAESFQLCDNLPYFQKREKNLKKDLSHLETPIQFFEELLTSIIISDFTK